MTKYVTLFSKTGEPIATLKSKDMDVFRHVEHDTRCLAVIDETTAKGEPLHLEALLADFSINPENSKYKGYIYRVALANGTPAVHPFSKMNSKPLPPRFTSLSEFLSRPHALVGYSFMNKSDVALNVINEFPNMPPPNPGDSWPFDGPEEIDPSFIEFLGDRLIEFMLEK